MNKGKLKKEKKQVSVLIVPHSTEKVKALNLTPYFYSILALFALLLTTITCLIIFSAHSLSVSNQLKQDVSKLSETNIEQKNLLIEQEGLLREKEKELEDVKQKEENISKQIREFTEKYKELTDQLTGSTAGATKTSRSGSIRNDRSLVEEVTHLRKILDNMDSTSPLKVSNSNALLETENKLKKYLSFIPTLWPTVGRLSSNFGYRKDPFTKKKTYHEGIDIAAPKGQKIYASASGTVTVSGRLSGYGLAVIIDHGHGISTLYGHTYKVLVKKGKQVKKGDLIATVGSTGRSTGPHLHFEVRMNEKQIDPLKYLEVK